jgi:hypothetical protein
MPRPMPRASVRLALCALALTAFALQGCLAAAAVGAAGAVVGTAVSATGAVVKTTAKVTGAVVGGVAHTVTGGGKKDKD